MKKLIAIVIAVGLAGALGWQVFEKVKAAQGNEQNQRRPRGNSALAVEVTAVRKATVRDVAYFSGSLLPKSYFVVAPKVGGRLERLLVNIGEAVKRDELIAVLDDAEYVQQLEQTRAELAVQRATAEEARSALEIGKREYERMLAMREKNITSEAQFDAAQARYQAQEAQLKVALAQIEQKQAVVKAAEVRLSYTKIHVSWGDSDVSGRVVGERFVDEGTMLGANDRIVSILDISSLTAMIHVIERDYSKIRVGQQAVVTTDAYPEGRFEGKVMRVAPLLKETVRQARVEVEIPNLDGRLKPGMFVRAEIEFARHENATVVPLSALTRREGRRGVFLADLEARTAKFVPLTLGVVSEGQAEVLDPPISGMVVTIGQHLLTDGAAIVVPEAEGAITPDRGGEKP